MSQLVLNFFAFSFSLGLTLSSLASAAMDSNAPPIELPTGIYSYQGNVIPKLFRKTKIFDHNSPEDLQIINSLKQKGYLCFRRSPTQTLCQIKTTTFQLPEGTAERTYKHLKGLPIEFPESPEIEFSHNGSTTKEWMIRGPFKIGGNNLTVYRITRTNEGDIFLAFPVDGENPISFLTYQGSSKFGFSMLLQGKDSEGWTLNYLFEALYEPGVK